MDKFIKRMIDDGYVDKMVSSICLVKKITSDEDVHPDTVRMLIDATLQTKEEMRDLFLEEAIDTGMILANERIYKEVMDRVPAETTTTTASSSSVLDEIIECLQKLSDDLK